MRSKFLILFGFFAVFAVAAAEKAESQSGPLSESYITSFPSGDVHKLLVVGDRLANGVNSVLYSQRRSDQRLLISEKYAWFNRVLRADFQEQLSQLSRRLVAEDINIAVVMMGTGDRRSVRVNGRKSWPGAAQWRAEYAKRIDEVMKTFKRRNVAVYWVGVPNLRNPKANAYAQIVNDVIQERAFINGLKYIDAYTTFLDEQGGWSAYGPDLGGKIRLLREQDGVHLTYAGSQKLVHFINRVFRRDLKQAREDRSVPLAGDSTEQERMRQALKRSASRPVTAGSNWSIQSQSAKNSNVQGDNARQVITSQETSETGGYFGGNGGEQREDNSRVEVKALDQAGNVTSIKFDIYRPAISSSVIALVTRKQSSERATQLGEKLAGQITGGLTVISTVTPANASLNTKRKLSPAQTPFFRVLVRGERIPSKPGRADDISWPLPEAAARSSQTIPYAPAPIGGKPRDATGERSIQRPQG